MCLDVGLYVTINIQNLELLAHEVGRNLPIVLSIYTATHPGVKNEATSSINYLLDPAEEAVVKIYTESASTSIQADFQRLVNHGVELVQIDEGNLPGELLGDNQGVGARDSDGRCASNFACTDKITIDREKIQAAAVKKVGANASDTLKKQAQVIILAEVFAHEFCHSFLRPGGSDNAKGFPKRNTRAYWETELGICEKNRYKRATGGNSPSWRQARFGIPWNPTPPQSLNVILTKHPKYFSSVNAAVKMQQLTTTRYKHTWTHLRK